MSLQITIKVIPNTGKTGCEIDKNGFLKCKLKSPPEKGKANDELIKLIAKKLDLPLKDVTILLGKTARIKKVQIKTSKTEQEIKLLLCDGLQLSI